MTTKRILVIDDEDDIREVVQLCLKTVGGWEVLTACSGDEGLTKAEAEQPDAILLDVMMPEMGYQPKAGQLYQERPGKEKPPCRV